MIRVLQSPFTFIFVAGLFIHIALFSVFWSTTSPIQLADELIFANLVFSGGGYGYGNFAFNWIYGLLPALSPNIIFVSKLLNLLVFLSSVGVLIWGLWPLLRNKGNSIWLVWLMLPSSMVFVGMFLPEILYYSFIFAGFGFLLRSQLGWNTYFIIAGGLFGFALLSKPHALGIIATLIVVLILGGVRSESRLASLLAKAAVLASIAVGLRLIAGFLVSGAQGLNLLSAYLPGSGIETPSLSLSSGQVGISGDETSFAAALGSSFSNYLIIGFIFYFPPLAYAVWAYFNEKHDTTVLLLIAMATIPTAMLFAAWAFGGAVTATGDDHSNRVLLRYSEFAVPLAWLALSEIRTRPLKPAQWLRITTAAGPVIAVVFFLLGALNGVEVFISDSTLFLGLAERPVIFGFVAIALSLWLAIPLRELRSSMRFILGAPAVISLSGLAIFTAVDLGHYYTSEAKRFEEASTYMAENLDAGDTLVVAGTRVSAATLLFESRFFDGRYSLANGYSTLDSEFTYGRENLVLIGEIYPPGDYGILRRSGEFAVYSKSSGLPLEEYVLEINPDASEIEGIGQYTAWGGWVNGSKPLNISLADKAVIGQKINLSLARHPLSSIDNVRITAENESAEISLPPNGEIVDLTLTVPEQGISEIRIDYFGAVELDHDYGSLEKYGLAFAGLRVSG